LAAVLEARFEAAELTFSGDERGELSNAVLASSTLAFEAWRLDP